MLDCLSNGRLIAGVGRGAPREYKIFNVPMAESRGRFEEAFEVMRRAWVEESFSFEGKFYNYRGRLDLAAAGAAAASADLGARRPARGKPSSGPRRTTSRSRPGVFAGPMREDTHPLLRAVPGAATAARSRPSTSA